MGSEDRGVNPSVLKLLTKSKTSNVWNYWFADVSVACGAFLYEAVRQRN
jgi:23S rRNA (guanosine2251-2'-O)-methyltransferase